MIETLEKNDVVINPEDYLDLALKFAFKYRPKNSFEAIKDTEIYSIACEELIRAARSYKSDRGDFSRFAWRFMMNRFFKSIRSQKRLKRSAKFSSLSKNEWVNIAEPNQQDSIKDILPLVLKDIDEDTPQDREDRQIVIEHYINGKQINLIAEVLRVTRVTIHNRMQRYFGKIKSRFNNAKGD